MDVDEFLDRELAELGLPTDKTEKSPDMQFQEGFEPSSLFEEIKANLSKGALEIAEQSYVQLWNTLPEQKLKWNKELYEQLSSLGRQFSSALNLSYNEVKRKAGQVYELISRGRAALREGKKELPFKLYAEIEEINNSIPNVFFEAKRVVQEQIVDYYKELKLITDTELIKRVSALIVDVNQLLDKINLAIRSNDMANAIVNYNKCLSLYNQIPEGFLRQKNSAGMRLLDIYKSLSIYNEIANLQRQLSQQPQKIGIREVAGSKYEEISKSSILSEKIERAKKHIEKGFYNEAYKAIQEALQLEPNDAEAKAVHAKIKTLQ